ncbi:MAG: class I SAM-dependent methyltransferase [Pseudonocardiaceae bacterium]
MLNRLRRAVRDRLVRVVDEVVTGHQRESAAALAAYHRESAAALAAHHRELEAALTAGIDRVVRVVHDVEFRSRRDLRAAAEREAAASSERFAREVMPTARVFDDPIATLKYALSLAPPDGMALEFGVYKGRTLTVIADARKHKQVFGFDSFQGLPEDWRSDIPAGTFATEQLPDIVGAELVVGLFDDTLGDFLANHPGPVAFLHLDADLYSSTVTVLKHVGPRLHPGSVIVFDEYFNYPGWQQHEHRAWREFVAQTGIECRYTAYTFNHEQVAVVVSGTSG